MRAIVLLLAIVVSSAALLQAEEEASRDEFWPEVDVYRTLGDRYRLFFLATISRNREEDF